jgi:hypothetical protein
MRIARPASMLDGFSRAPTVGAPSAAVDHVRTCDQPQDREGARTHRAGQATRYRRRGNRIGALFAALRWVAIGKRTYRDDLLLVRFSNRPFRVKRFQAIHHSSVDVAHGLALLFGIGTQALPSWGFKDEVEQSIGRPRRQCDGRSKRPNDLTSSIVPRGTSFHRWVELCIALKPNF